MSLELRVDVTRTMVDLERRYTFAVDNEDVLNLAFSDDNPFEYPTGILVRARWEQRWVNADIYWLTLDSLRRWLRSRGGDNPWAESVVEILLNHQDRT